MSEETKQNEQIKKPEMQSAVEIRKILKDVVASGYTPIYVNSLEKEVGFKEVTVSQQKSLSRIMIGNENRKDIIYDAQCAIINETALEEGFDIYNYTELDRLKIMIALYQANMFNNDVQFTCKECGHENKYKLNFDSVLHKLDQLSIDPIEFTYEKRNLTFKFIVKYPSVRLVSSFNKNYFAKHKSNSKRDVKINDTMSNMEYVNLFIDAITVFDATGKQLLNISMKGYKPEDIEGILQDLPQDALYSERGVLTFISKEMLQKLNDSFEKHVCQKCGTVQEEENTNQIESFF